MNILNTRIKNRIDTTENWNANPSFIPLKGEIIIYSDYKVIDNITYMGIKIGDGLAYLIDLPFIGEEILSKIDSHIADTIHHITQNEREDWNEKISCLEENGNLIFFSSDNAIL